MLGENNVSRVKLYDAEANILRALAGSGIEVMVGIPNFMLELLASSRDAAEEWVEKNVTRYLKLRKRVNIRYVAVGNEPFPRENSPYDSFVLPALKNIQLALTQSSGVKATVPFSAGVFEVAPELGYAPSTGKFKGALKPQMLEILEELWFAEAPFTVNIHPFISKHLQGPSYPVEFAFFDGNAGVLVDKTLNYTNAFDATYDTVVAALDDARYRGMKIIVGETGWPSDCDQDANPGNAQRYNQGLLNRIMSHTGTPMRPQENLHVYIFSLFDEDLKSTAAGDFERHWGIFYYDGKRKYNLRTSGEAAGDSDLKNVPGVEYQPPRWCVLDESAGVTPEVLEIKIGQACERTDCTPLHEGGSCRYLSLEGRASYAFNSRYQRDDQNFASCEYPIARPVNQAPSFGYGECKFILQIKVKSAATASRQKCFRLVLLALILLV